MSLPNILFCNIALRGRSGTEMFLWDLLRTLKKRGYGVGVFSPRSGALSDALRAAGIPVWERVADISWQPDLLQCHHSMETLQLLQRFPGVPAIYVCHDAKIWFDDPPPFGVHRYVAVDEYCRDRVQRRTGLPPDEILVIQNGVDLERFHRKEPIAKTPRKALLFRTVAAGEDHLAAVREACRKSGLSLDEIGGSTRKTVSDPENILPHCDLVFAKARCALEAMACGCAVILVGPEGLGPLVVPEHFEEMRRMNFGRNLLQPVFDEKILIPEIKRYEPGRISQVCERVRSGCSLDLMADAYGNLYSQMLNGPIPSLPKMPGPDDFLARLCENAGAEIMALERNLNSCKEELSRQRRKRRVIRNFLGTVWRLTQGQR